MCNTFFYSCIVCVPQVALCVPHARCNKKKGPCFARTGLVHVCHESPGQHLHCLPYHLPNADMLQWHLRFSMVKFQNRFDFNPSLKKIWRHKGRSVLVLWKSFSGLLPSNPWSRAQACCSLSVASIFTYICFVSCRLVIYSYLFQVSFNEYKSSSAGTK